MSRALVILLAGCAAPPPTTVHVEAPATAEHQCKTAREDATEKLTAFCAEAHDDCAFRFADPGHPDVGVGREVPDLDGDGVAEISWSWVSGAGSLRGASYLYRGGPGCAVLLLGREGRTTFKPLWTRHEGWSDLRVEDATSCGGPCPCTPFVSVWVFHHGAYHEDETRREPGSPPACYPPQ